MFMYLRPWSKDSDSFEVSFYEFDRRCAHSSSKLQDNIGMHLATGFTGGKLCAVERAILLCYGVTSY